jgi:hypothetical protein
VSDPPDYGTWWILGGMFLLIIGVLVGLLVLMAVLHNN